MDDEAVAALEYERNAEGTSEEMFTSCHRGDTYNIFWTGPRDFVLEFLRVSEGLSTEELAVYGYLDAWRCTRHVDTGTHVTCSG